MYETPNYAAAALLLPPSGLLFLALVVLFALRRSPRLRNAIVALCLAGVLALSLPVVAFALMRLLEPAPLDEASLAPAQAIVILGGGRNRAAPEWGGITVSGFTLQRLRYGARLARRTSLPVLVTGGAPDGAGATEGDLMRAALRDEFGVDVRWNDTGSRNTHENAAYSRRTLQPLGIRRIVLVTDGWHCARARREFERGGFTVIAAPTGLIGSRPFTLYQLVPNVESLRYAHIALRELAGALWYRFVDPDWFAGDDTQASRRQAMQTKKVLTHDDVLKIAAAAEAEARANKWAVGISIVDDGGHPLWFVRLDGAPPISAYLAPEKARTAALGRRESRVYEEMINQGRTAFLSAPLLAAMLEGGLPVVVDGQIVGAVGVSGVKSSEDAQIARAGIAALGS